MLDATQWGIAVRDDTSPEDQLASAKERRARFFPPRQPKKPAPVVAEEIELPDFLAHRQPLQEWLATAPVAAFKPSSATRIIQVVVAGTGIPKIDLVSERRTAPVVRARQIACWLMRNLTILSLPQIGQRLGGRDHTTVLHACRKIDALMELDPDVKALVSHLSDAVRASCTA